MTKAMSSDSTKMKILLAAHRVFIRKGMDGARMQEIADEAGINKALLHYYFHSKDQLFNEVFYGILSQMIPRLVVIFSGDEPFLEKVEAIVTEYDTYLSRNPILPQFIYREINRDPNQTDYFTASICKPHWYDRDTLYRQTLVPTEAIQGGC